MVWHDSRNLRPSESTPRTCTLRRWKMRELRRLSTSIEDMMRLSCTHWRGESTESNVSFRLLQRFGIRTMPVLASREERHRHIADHPCAERTATTDEFSRLHRESPG